MDSKETNVFEAEKIEETGVYTPKEVQKLLKVSPATINRLIAKGMLRAGRVGRQYRIMGKEVLRLVSPKLEDKVGIAYNKVRNWAHEKGED